MTTALQFGKMRARVYDSNEALGAAAAHDLAEILRVSIAQRGESAIILATGNSQRSFLNALRIESRVEWEKVVVFHMDEYLGISDHHPASFRRFFHYYLKGLAPEVKFHGIEGDAPDLQAEIARYSALLKLHQPIACVMGIGENAHLAFNDPPADFVTPDTMHLVTLAEASRRQQVSEGHFEGLDQVPRQALTLTIPALLKPPHVLAVVPERRKAPAVKAAIEGLITPDCPASILPTMSHVKLYLDPDSASLLNHTVG